MRKLTSVLLLLSILTLTACQSSGTSSHNIANQTTGVADILASATASSEVTSEATTETEETNPYDIEARLANGAEGVDIDLTVLSANMVYSEVFCMVYEPDEYIGKIIKMEGTFIYYYDEATGNEYFACIIKDATQCCAQGIEFVPTSDYTYPDDFPADGEPICVIGTFDKYEENGNTYLTLRDSVLVEAEEE